MNIDKQEAREITTMVEDTLLQFKDAMKFQEEQNLRISRRTSHMLRYGLATIILLSIGVVFLTWSQKNDMKKMNGYVEGMTKNISVMSNAIVKMQANMRSGQPYFFPFINSHCNILEKRIVINCFRKIFN